MATGVTQAPSFFASNPDITAQSLRLQQQQALAQALMQQGMTPVQTEGRQIGGVAYRVSPMEGLAKMLQVYAGKKSLDNTIQQQADLQAQQYRLYGDALKQAYGVKDQPTAFENGATAMGEGASAGMPGPTQAAAVRQDQLTSTGDFQSQRRAALQLALMGQADAAAKIMEGINTPTNDQKNALDPVIGGSVRNNLQTQNMTPLQKLMLQRKLVPDGSPQASQLDAAIAKENYVAPIDAKPGTPVLDPFTFQLKAYAPKAADGMAVQFGKDATGATVPTSATAIPGYAGGNASIVGPEAAARSSNSIINVTGAGGESVPAWAGPAAGAGGAQLGLGGGGAPSVPPGMPGTPRNMPGTAPAVAPAPVRPRLGQTTADKEIAVKTAQDVAALPVQVQQSKQTVAGLENAYQTILQLEKSGKGVSKSVDALAIVNNLGLPLMKDDVNGYQTLKKFLENSASTAAASNGFTGSDARFEQFKAGQPNAETMNPEALKGAIRYVLSQHDAAIARANFIGSFMQQNQGDPQAALKAQQAWASSYSPKVFEFSRMTPEERSRFKAGMTEQQRAQFGAAYNNAHQQGWVQ